MMNLTPTELERLTVFSAAELARRHRSLGIKLSHPEAVALIADEMLTAARRDMPYDAIVDMAGRLLTTDDVMPGVRRHDRLDLGGGVLRRGHEDDRRLQADRARERFA